MKKSVIFAKRVSTLTLLLSYMLLIQCNKEEIPIKQTEQDVNFVPKTRSSQFHWRCTNLYCGFLNPGWNNICTNCKTDYNSAHTRLVVSFFNNVRKVVSTINNVDPNAAGEWIQLTPVEFTAYLPEPWYESSGAIKYYNDLKKSSSYMMTPEYAEGVDFAWYRTTRVLYPKLHNPTKVESDYDKFMLRESRNFTGFKGAGLKDGSQAAVKAFANYK